MNFTRQTLLLTVILTLFLTACSSETSTDVTQDQNTTALPSTDPTENPTHEDETPVESNNTTPPTYTPPTISGTPKSRLYLNETYQFLPTTTGSQLTFSIENQPEWLEFNSSNGLLSGSASSEGNFSNITISLSDGTTTRTLTPFSINIHAARDIAHQFGIATQGTNSSYQYYDAAQKAIDANNSTYNHTSSNVGENWWQVALPSPTSVKEIIIQSRASFSSRISGAKVYLTDTPYNGTLDVNNLVATLEGMQDKQYINFSSSKAANYLIIEAVAGENLHMLSVEVYGNIGTAPMFNTHLTHYLIEGTSPEGTLITKLSATDYQDDPLHFNIDASLPFSINEMGELTVAGDLLTSNYTFNIEVTDGVNATETTLSIDVTSATAVDEVLTSGDVVHTFVSEDELIEATLDEIEATRVYMNDAKTTIFNLNADGTSKGDGTSLNAISWDPSHDASLFFSTLGVNTPLLYTNAVSRTGNTIYKKEIAIIGEKGEGRYLLFGGNPLRVQGDDAMNQLLENSLAWLTGKEDLKSAPFNVVIAQLDESYWFSDESKTREWLDAHYSGTVSYNSENSCDANALVACLEAKPDLLIISQVTQDSDNILAITTAINNALTNGISVLYIHHDGDQKPLGKALFSTVFDVGYEKDNYWSRLSLDAYDPTLDINTLSDALRQVKTMFTHFKDYDYLFNWSQCHDGNGNYGTQYDNCSDLAELSSDFQEGATVVKQIMDALDAQQKDIFSKEGYRLQKLLALTADKFRQSVHFPMDKITTDDNTFMRAFYSDHAIYNYRAINPTQPDMGNFSRSDFSHIQSTTKTVSLLSRKYFRSTGVYALPGETIRVTRNDNSDLIVKVFINTLRSGATHQYQSSGYNRPKYLKTPYFELKTDETIAFTSPYGGPVQLSFSANDLNVSVTFEHIGEHPYWSSSEDDASFTNKLDAGDYDWAEVVTTGFEVHSKLEKMRTSVADEKWQTPQNLANATETYMSNYPHVLAGFKGQGIDVVAEIEDFATDYGLQIENLDIVKHMNADQATCGYGCSGNPYDAYWAFSPVGHGDVHELGHGLEKSRFRFEGWTGHSTTNPYSYYTKSMYHANTGGDPSCQSLPFKEVFEKLQASVSETNATAYLQTNLWQNSGWSQQFMVTLQAMMQAQKQGSLTNGWHLLARLHILEREIKRAKEDWDAKKASIGFDTYTLEEFNALRNNDWLLISLSFGSSLDFRAFLSMMGISYSDKASAQVVSFNYPMVPQTFFVSTPDGYCKSDIYGTYLDKESLAVDGNSTFPY